MAAEKRKDQLNTIEVTDPNQSLVLENHREITILLNVIERNTQAIILRDKYIRMLLGINLAVLILMLFK
ncbi:hypothetical protein [Kurthia huakuii]|uniref:hypothetical protein n=1 Tax=Kurthia huakuii TaxID=1421019 RepID=UPI00049592E3|nr:hypothetical protein [Kurthia huakuii]MBM7698652.1 hypothetical protein [Kurthia huakuii]